jgi:hypothetical protein
MLFRYREIGKGVMRGFRILALVAALAPASPAAAEDRPTPSTEALAAARELFAVTFERAGVQLNAQAVEHTWPSVEKALRLKNPGLDEATLANLRGEFERIRLRKMQELLKDAPVIYARYLKEEEMREIIAFYRTPAGTRLMQIVPPLLSEMFAVALPGMPAVINDTHEEFLTLARQRGLIK